MNSAMELWISEHSDYAKEQLVLNNQGIIGTVLKSLNLNPLDEDLFATGLVGIVKATNKFDAEKGFAFSTYATQIVRNEILQLFRKKRIVPRFSLDEPCRSKDGVEVSYAEIIADDRRFDEEIIESVKFESVIKSLNEREKRIIFLKMDGEKQDEIANMCGISQAQVSRIIKKVREKIKND